LLNQINSQEGRRFQKDDGRREEEEEKEEEALIDF